MKKIIYSFIILALFSCKEKKVNLNGDAIIAAKDFTAAFAPITLPVVIADTSIIKATADTTTISLNVFTQFVPDTALGISIKAAKNTIIHPVGSIEKGKEIYLLATFKHNKKTSLLVFVFTVKNKFLASKQLLANNTDDGYLHSLSINKEPTFLISREKTDNSKQLHFSRTGWVFNSGSNQFMIVINDGNEDPKKEEVINPIDTLPRKNKLSGNYVKDSKNFIALRDGRDQNTYAFFIHFEKQEGKCTGELKGTLKMKDATHAVYTEGGDPCAIDFNFDNNTIDVKEKGSCGNRRGMDCYFEDSYVKKKEAKPKKKK